MSGLTPKIKQALTNVLFKLDLKDLNEVYDLWDIARNQARAREQRKWKKGQWLKLEHDGFTYIGQVESANKKTLSVTVYNKQGNLISYRAPYTMVERCEKPKDLKRII